MLPGLNVLSGNTKSLLPLMYHVIFDYGILKSLLTIDPNKRFSYREKQGLQTTNTELLRTSNQFSYLFEYYTIELSKIPTLLRTVSENHYAKKGASSSCPGVDYMSIKKYESGLCVILKRVEIVVFLRKLESTFCGHGGGHINDSHEHFIVMLEEFHKHCKIIHTAISASRRVMDEDNRRLHSNVSVAIFNTVLRLMSIM